MSAVCIVTARFFPQIVGSGVSAYLMAKELSKRGHDVTVLTDLTLKKELEQQEPGLSFKVSYIEGLESFATGKTSMHNPTQALYAYIIKISPDIIHACNFMPMLILSILKPLFRCPIVFTFYNTPLQNRRSTGFYLNPELDLSLSKFILKSDEYDLLIAGSEAYRKAATDLGANKDKLRLSYLGIDMDGLKMPTDLSAEILFKEYLGNQLGIGDNYIVLPSRITEQKGILDAIKALSLLNISQPIKLLLTGMAEPFDRGYAKKVIELSNLLNVNHSIVMPLKPIPRRTLPVFLSNAALAVIPSHYEGLGLAAIEAQALGVPLVASQTTGLDEVVENEFNGLTFTPGNERQLADSISKLLKNDRLANHLANNAKQSVMRFDIRRHVDFLEQAYSELAKAKNG